MIRRLRLMYLRRKARWTDSPQELVMGRFPHRTMTHIYPDGTEETHEHGLTCICEINWILDRTIARLDR